MIKRRIKITEDGSSTIELIGLDEHFHSTHGAIQESEHIYLQNGFMKLAKENDKLNVLEMGFGSGLNAILTLLYASEKKVFVNYQGIEAFPIESDLVDQLNFPAQLQLNKLNKEFFNAMHSSSWSTKIKMGSFFCFEKINAKLEEIALAKDTFDLIYWDAFNPDLQPELWSEEIFRKMYLAMKDEGVLITYSAKGKVKRALKAAGFTLYALPGPPGKREITQALKII